MEIAVLGTEDFVLGFELCGIKQTHVAEGNDFFNKFEAVFNDRDVGVVIVDEHEWSKAPRAVIKKVESTVSPIVIPLSEAEHSADIRELIKRCIGIDLWK